MNYQKIYDQIIERAKNRKLEGYKERHHIVPKCLGGSNDKNNLVELTAQEHFICHMLLCEIYPHNVKLYQALWLMSTNKNKKEEKRYKVSSKTYERIKIEASKLYKNRKISKEELNRRSVSQKKQWYDKRKEQGLIINEKNINNFLEIYSNFILTENNKHCINYCYNNNLNIDSIICPCGNGIKRFENYTRGYKTDCSIRCSNKFTSEQRLKTRESKGHFDNSKKRIRKKEIEGLSKSEISKLKGNKISKKLKGKIPYKPNTNGKIILQYDLNDNFIKEWPSIRQAGFCLSKTNGEIIRKCLKGFQTTAYGFKWKFADASSLTN